MNDMMEAEKGGKRSFKGLFIGAVVLCVALAVSAYWMKHRPHARRRPPEEHAVPVRTMALEPGEHRVRIHAVGFVQPARTVELTCLVSGTVVSLHPQMIPGGIFNKGEEMLRIDDTDYRLALRRKRSEVARTKAELAVEKGRREIARKEYELLGEDVPESDRSLILREPYLASAQAAYDAAKAGLAQAELDLARTRVAAPFNAVVRARKVDVGSLVSRGTPVATLAGTDSFWVEITLATHLLKWIRLPASGGGDGAKVTFHDRFNWGDAVRTGHLIRLKADLEPEGLQAQVIAEIPDPLNLDGGEDRPRVLLGSYLDAVIDGELIRDVFQIPRTALHDGETIWILKPDDTLDIRHVESLWGDDTYVFLKRGVVPGERLVVSDLAAPVAGMKLRDVGAGNPGDGAGDDMP